MTASERYTQVIEERRRHCNEMAHEDDANTFTRLSWQSKVDSLDLILSELPQVFRDVTDEATFGIEVAA